LQLVGPGKWNPLVYVGLACAGANTPETAGGDGGILAGQVIAELNLDQVNLAVLSACETGLGESSGPEGIQGFQLAFHYAGCPNVIASLWKVNDAATGLLMARFYHELWVNSKPPAEALRRAQLFIYRSPDLVEEWSKKLPKWDEIRSAPAVHETRLDEVLKQDLASARKDRTPTFLWAAFVLSGPGEYPLTGAGAGRAGRRRGHAQASLLAQRFERQSANQPHKFLSHRF
jgi:CHAT domain-containing protein